MEAGDELLTAAEAATRAGVKRSTWSAYVARGYAPLADDPAPDTPMSQLPRGWRPRWRASTVDAFLSGRDGQGRRTDLHGARTERARRDRAALAEPAPAAEPGLRGWLDANRAALMTVADVLLDHRDELVDAAPDAHRADLAAAIDQAGSQMRQAPTRGFASSVSYALFLLGPHGPARLDATGEIGAVLAHHGWLRDEFEALRRP